MRITKAENERMVIRIGILLVSFLLIGIGIAKQEYLEVMQKAVKICLECIGIG